MKLKYILPAVLFLPITCMASDVGIKDCYMGVDLPNAVDLSDDSIRVTRSLSGGTPMPFSGIGSTIIFKLPEDTKEVNIEESERQARVSEEFNKILKTANAPIKAESQAEPPTGGGAAATPDQKFKCVKIVQTYERSRIAVQAIDEKNSKKTEKTYIGGPIEHWYFSADLPVNSMKQLSYDPKTGSYVERTVPTSFFVGLNYKVGDIFVNSKAFDVSLDRLSGKIMAKVNGPTEAYGLGVGYDFGPVVLFGARIYTKNDPATSSAYRAGVYSTVWGVSFDIERGIGWLSGK